MKKLLALMLSLMLALTGAAAFAEATSSAVTITNDFSIDREAAKALMPSLGIDDDNAEVFNAIVALLDAVGEEIVIADNGVQYDLNLNGQTALTIAGEQAGDGIVIGSTLFPNYSLTMSFDTINNMLQSLVPAVPESDNGLPGVDINALSEAVAGYVNEFLGTAMTALEFGEPETGVYETDAATFNTMTPLTVDVPAMAEALQKLMEQLESDETVGAALQAMQATGMNVDPTPADENGKIDMDNLPAVTAAIYSNTYEDDTVDGNTYVAVDVTPAGATEPATLVDVAVIDAVVTVSVEVPAEQNAFAVTVVPNDTGAAIRMDYNSPKNYCGLDLTVEAADALKVTLNGYYQDEQKPMFTDVMNITMDGERTMTVADSAKTTLAIEDLMADEEGELISGLAMDALMNGLGGVISVATEAVPEASSLIGMIGALAGGAAA